MVEAFLEQASAEVGNAVGQALDVLRSRGAVLTPVALPADFDSVWPMHRKIMAFELARYHQATYGAPGDGYSTNLLALLAEGRAIPESKYRAALEHQRAFRQQMTAALAGLDGWLMPATNTAAPPPDSTGDPRFNSPWSYAGLPAVTLPCGLAPSNGTGIGLQLVGLPGHDSEVLAGAAWCEQHGRFSIPAAPD